jgi:hypothetical protein
VSPLSLLTFFAAAKKVSAAPHRGEANRPLTKQGKANNPKKTAKNQGAAGKPRQKGNKKNLTLKPLAEDKNQQQHRGQNHPPQRQLNTEYQHQDAQPDKHRAPQVNPSAHARLAQKTPAQRSQRSTREQPAQQQPKPDPAASTQETPTTLAQRRREPPAISQQAAKKAQPSADPARHAQTARSHAMPWRYP